MVAVAIMIKLHFDDLVFWILNFIEFKSCYYILFMLDEKLNTFILGNRFLQNVYVAKTQRVSPRDRMACYGPLILLRLMLSTEKKTSIRKCEQ